MLAQRVEQGQFHGTPGRVAPASAIVAGHGRQPQCFRQPHGPGKVLAIAQLSGELAFLEKLERRVDRLTGDVRSRHPFAEAHGAVRQLAGDHEVIGVGACMRGVLDRLPQWNAHMPGCQFRDPHRAVPCRLPMFGIVRSKV